MRIRSGQTLDLDRHCTELASITYPTSVLTLPMSMVCPDYVQQNILLDDKFLIWTIGGKTLDMDRYWTNFGFIKVQHLSELCPDPE